MGQQENLERRRDERQMIQGSGQFSLNEDVCEARSLDVSENGARIMLQQPVKVVFKMPVGAYEMERRANIVWAKRGQDGKMEYGLEYLPVNETVVAQDMPEEEETTEIHSTIRLTW